MKYEIFCACNNAHYVNLCVVRSKIAYVAMYYKAMFSSVSVGCVQGAIRLMGGANSMTG